MRRAAIGLLLLVGLASAIYFRNDIRNLLAYGPGDRPIYDPGKDCKWVKTNFQKADLTTFIDDCTGGLNMSFNDFSGKVEGTWQGNTNVAFTIQVLLKDPGQIPRDIIEKYYAQLTQDTA